MITARDTLFFERLFTKTVSASRKNETLEHVSYYSRTDYIRNTYVRPMKGFIEPVGILMAWLMAYNEGGKHIGKELIASTFKETFAARHKAPQKQIAALKCDIDAYSNQATRSSVHRARKLNCDVDSLTTLRTVIKNFLRSINSEGFESMLFLGRDAWWFAVVAQRLSYNYVYDSTMSRIVANSPEGAKRFGVCLAQSMAYSKDCVFVDTGFEGSIMRQLTRHNPSYSDIAIRLFSASDRVITKHHAQPFISFALSRNYALAMEYFPKINMTGRVKEGAIEQIVNPVLENVVIWYAMSVWFYFAETPNFVKRDIAVDRPRQGFY